MLTLWFKVTTVVITTSEHQESVIVQTLFAFDAFIAKIVQISTDVSETLVWVYPRMMGIGVFIVFIV